MEGDLINYLSTHGLRCTTGGIQKMGRAGIWK